MSDMRLRAAAGLQAGDVFEVTRTFGQADTEAFGQLTRDFNPVHYDEDFARGKGMAGLICHGLLVANLICEVGGQIAWLASGMSFRFRRPVYFGDTVTCRLTITHLDERGRAKAEAVFTNQRGEVVQEAVITGILPSPDERQALAAMVKARQDNPPAA